MHNEILVSVITISYNQEDFIENAIKSVLNQNYPNIEYIVIDAGSNDQSRKIITKYQKQISKIIFEPDEGPADGLNKGFKIAKGDILCFLNSDDILLDHSIETVVQTFKDNNVDVVYGNAWIIDKYGKKVKKFYSDKFNINMALYGGSFIAQQSTFFKKKSYTDTQGFNKNNKIAWDYEFFIDVALNGSKFHKIDNFLSGYRVHDESITGGKLNNKIIFDQIKKNFSKIKKREFNKFDYVILYFYRYLRKILNLKSTYERIKKGPISKL